MLAGMQGNAKEKEALDALRDTLTKAVQRPWFEDITGLIPELEAVLQAAGGPLEDVHGSKSARAFYPSWRGLRLSCRTNRDKLGPDHAVSARLKVILNLTDFSREVLRELYKRYF